MCTLVSVVCAAALSAGCDDAAITAFVPVLRLVDHQEPAPPDPGFAAPGYAALLGDTRPVLSAARSLALRGVRCPWGKRCSTHVPEALAGAPWLVIEIPHDPKRPEKKGPPTPNVQWLLLARPRSGVVELAPGLGRRVRERIIVRGMQPPRERDVTTTPVVVPDGARLRFATGVQEAAWHVGAPPIDMTVTALLEGGDVREIYRRRLDPSQVEDDRSWKDADIPLEELAGQSVRFRFASRPFPQDDPQPSLPVWGDPTIWAPRERDVRPSVVIVSIDTLRARSTSAYGYERDTTPYLTELARSATLFERAFTTYANTLGAHMSLFTGCEPASHGVIALDRTLPPERQTLAEALRAAGYDTAAVTEDGLLEGKVGFRRGFTTWFENEVYSNGGDAPETFARALAWARSREHTPFYLFVHTYAVHLPYTPPEEYRRLFDDGWPAEERPPVEREHLRYEQEIRAVDDELRGFVAGLTSIVPADRLLLVIGADHGEEFHEHGQMTHLQLYDEVMQVPLLMRWDGVLHAGARSDALVSLIDVAPTVLDLLGLPELPGADGVSLAGIVRGDETTTGRDVLFGQSVPYGLTGNKWHFVARAEDAKCIVAQDDSVECFDLTVDPGEQQPLAPSSSPRLAEVHRRAEEYRARAMPAIDEGGAQTVADGLREVDSATERKLRALGYAQ